MVHNFSSRDTREVYLYARESHKAVVSDGSCEKESGLPLASYGLTVYVYRSREISFCTLWSLSTHSFERHRHARGGRGGTAPAGRRGGVGA